MKYSTILFDADETVLDFFHTEEQSLRKSFEAFGLPYDDRTHPVYHEINAKLWHEFSMGRLEKSVLTVLRFEQLFRLLGLDCDPTAFKDCYESWIAKGFFVVEGAEAVLRRLQAAGYRLYCTTNGLKRTQNERLKGSGLDRYFLKLFISEEAGSQKPQRAYFDYVFRNIEERDLSRVVLIGDSLTADIAGGNHAGIDTVWYNPAHAERTGDAVPTHTIDRLDKIFDLV